MPTISTLRVLVTASAGPFKKALGGATSVAQKFGKSIGAIGLQVAKFGAGIGVAAGAGLLLLTKQAYSAIDAMGKLSSNIGVSTKSLAGLHLAAELGGVSTEGLDKALVKMQRSVGQAGQGLSTQVRAFKSLGLTFEELSAMSPEQQFAAISEGMKNLGSASERAAVAADIFGRSGVDLMNILAGGADALKNAQQEADALGLSINNIEAKQVEQANDAFLKVRRALTGIGRQIAVATAPAVEWLSKKFTEAAEAGGGIREKVGGALNVVIKIMGGVLDAVDLLKIGWLGAQKLLLNGLEFLARGFNDWIQSIINGINVLLPKAQELSDVSRNLETGFGQAAEELDQKILDIVTGPSGQQRVSKFFGMVTEESKKAATAAVEAQQKAFTAAMPEPETETEKKAREDRLKFGFRSDEFIAALRGTGGMQTAQATPQEKKIDKTNEILTGIDAFLRRANIGLS